MTNPRLIPVFEDEEAARVFAGLAPKVLELEKREDRVHQSRGNAVPFALSRLPRVVRRENLVPHGTRLGRRPKELTL